jgi:uncharacterized protein (DUF433 family)
MEAVSTEHIAITPGICGGKPRIAGHRIKVQHVAVWHERMGMTVEEIVAQHPGITLADVHAALAYYHDHRAEIEADIKEGEEFADKLRAGEPSIFEKAKQRNGGGSPLSPG